ncbi:hypothetical protein [Methanosphaerula subterraneus]
MVCRDRRAGEVDSTIDPVTARWGEPAIIQNQMTAGSMISAVCVR